MSGHAFLAIDITDDERHALSAALAEASPGPPIPGKRPPESNWHITLRFLGECSDTDADRVIHEVDRSLSGPPGRVFVDGIGAFPRPSKASVVFASIDDHEGQLARLAGICESAARDCGFEPDERPYVPHLTLSRVRPQRDVRRLFDGYGPCRVPIVVSGVTLFRTVRSRSGIAYEPVHRLDLDVAAS